MKYFHITRKYWMNLCIMDAKTYTDDLRKSHNLAYEGLKLWHFLIFMLNILEMKNISSRFILMNSY